MSLICTMKFWSSCLGDEGEREMINCGTLQSSSHIYYNSMHTHFGTHWITNNIVQCIRVYRCKEVDEKPCKILQFTLPFFAIYSSTYSYINIYNKKGLTGSWSRYVGEDFQFISFQCVTAFMKWAFILLFLFLNLSLKKNLLRGTFFPLKINLFIKMY